MRLPQRKRRQYEQGGTTDSHRTLWQHPARSSCDQALQSLIYDEGSFWRLGEGFLWEPIDALELRRRVLLYGDQPIKDRPGSDRYYARCLDVVRVIQDSVDRPGFFSEAPAGLVLKQTFFEVDGSKLLKVPLTSEHRQRFRYPFDFDGDAYPKRFIELLIPCLASEPDVEAMIEMLRQFVAASLMHVAALSKPSCWSAVVPAANTVQRCFARSFRREGSRALPLTTWAKGFERQALRMHGSTA